MLDRLKRSCETACWRRRRQRVSGLLDLTGAKIGGYFVGMIELPKDAPGSAASGRSGRPMLGLCQNGKRRLIPFRLLKTGDDDRTPLYGRPFKCRECAEVTLFAIESQAELDKVRQTLPPPSPPLAPTTHPPHDPDADRP